ncbi:unnamed protein product [Rotaria sordida]|uniref:Uncharacterized protein n=2 Tax=Rotaria sordida TaxID=392033 RepID=A0A815QTJ8_9BILA|nr:unnamed protein product [Rotaria sordida]
MTEEKIRQIFGEMRNKFPSDGMTEAEFIDMFNKDSQGNSLGAPDLCKLLFKTIDQDNSGKINLYKLILTAGLFEKGDPTASIKCLFRLCDSNHDGLTACTEIHNIFSNILMQSSDGKNDPEEMEGVINRAMDIIKKNFNNKTHISEQEFAKICAEHEDIQTITQYAYTILTSGLDDVGEKFA